MGNALLIDARRQLGSEPARLMAGPGLTAVNHEDLEISDQDSTDALLERVEPAERARRHAETGP